MLSNQIQDWLTNAGSFAAGLDLLAQANNATAHNSLAQYLSFPFIPPHAHVELTDCLKQYLIEHPATMRHSPQSQPAAASYRVEDPPEIVRLRTKGRHLLKERDAHRAQLLQMVDEEEKYTDQDRYLTATAIMEIQADIDDVYQNIELYQVDGTLPTVDSKRDIVKETVNKMNRLGSVRSAVSRLKKRIDKMGESPEKTTLETEMMAKQVEIDNLKDELGL